MTHQVSAVDVVARPTAVVRATTTWAEFPALWPQLSNEVWACLRAGGIDRGCRNVMLYLDDVHRGSYAGLGEAHEDVAEWCRLEGLRPAGPRWEEYGPRREDPAQVWTDV